MVVAGKVFRVSEAVSMAEIASELEGYRFEEPYEEDGFKFTLVREVAGLTAKAERLRGIYSHDYVIHVFHRGKSVATPRTVEALFSFANKEGRIFLTVAEKKRLANFVANRLSEILFKRVGGIVEARIAPEVLKEFHLRNPEDTKITFFDNVDIPNVDKLSLYGVDLMGTSLFEEYCRRGDLWYIVARAREYGYVVGVTRDASVTIFNITDKEKYLQYVEDEIYPLILKTE
ncbi:MAG: hypothetical protein RMK50_02715 [Nitrososphaerota archaeon]|nr:hypothetical protein [Candidatus Bathyarchaeota archaeon]MDW8193722.1 hypothetical protein [Nitrososphaerota archaeon]